MVNKLKHQEAADLHDVSVELVARLILKNKNQKDYLKSQIDHNVDKASKQEAVYTVTREMLDNSIHINNALMVKKQHEMLNGSQVSLSFVKKIMKHDLNLSFRKVKKIPKHTNSTRNL